MAVGAVANNDHGRPCRGALVFPADRRRSAPTSGVRQDGPLLGARAGLLRRTWCSFVGLHACDSEPAAAPMVEHPVAGAREARDFRAAVEARRRRLRSGTVPTSAPRRRRCLAILLTGQVRTMANEARCAGAGGGGLGPSAMSTSPSPHAQAAAQLGNTQLETVGARVTEGTPGLDNAGGLPPQWLLARSMPHLQRPSPARSA